VVLKVYDVLGKEIATLVNIFQQAGTYKVSFNYNKQLSSGIYSIAYMPGIIWKLRN